MSLRLSGASDFGAVARAARLARKDLVPAMTKQLKTLGPPARREVKASALKVMPASGGYARTLSRSTRIRTRVDTGYTTAGITLTSYAAGKAQRRMIRELNAGRLRHPVYGHRRRAWVTQKIKSGFWDTAMVTVEDLAHDRIRMVLSDTIRTLATN